MASHQAATQAAPRPQLKVVFAAVSGPAPEKQEDFHVMFWWYGAVLAGLYLVPRPRLESAAKEA